MRNIALVNRRFKAHIGQKIEGEKRVRKTGERRSEVSHKTKPVRSLVAGLE